MLMLAWLGADAIVLREWVRNGTPPRALETSAIRIVIAAVIAMSLVTLAWLPGGHEGESHVCHARNP